jgi:hypothetical protein
LKEAPTEIHARLMPRPKLAEDRPGQPALVATKEVRKMPEELYKHDGERRIALVEIFEGKAEWRRRRAVEHPDDKRNLEAATIFDRLAKSVDGLPRTTLNAFFELYEDYEGDELSEELRQVGFHSDPMTAEDFCRSYIASRTSGRRN